MEAVARYGLGWLDVVIVLVLAWGAFRGLRVGFIKLLTSMVGYVLGFWGAATWAPSVVHLAESKFSLVTTLSLLTRQYVTIPAEVALQPVKSLNPAEIVKQILGLPLPQDLRTAIAGYVSTLLANVGTVGANTVGEYLYKAFASLCLHAIAFLVILFIIRGISVVMSDVLTQTLASGKPASLLNRLMGAVLGVVEICVALIAIIGLITPIANLASGKGASSIFTTSLLAPQMAKAFMWGVTRLGGGF